MTPVAMYIKHYKQWTAGMYANGKWIGPAFSADTKEQAMFLLGVEYGRHPQKFAQPLSDIVS